MYPENVSSFGCLKQMFTKVWLQKKCRIKKPAIVRKFYLKDELLPENIPRETAEIILFIGRIVWIMHNKPATMGEEKYQLKLEQDLWDGKSLEYYKSIQSLENLPFNIPVFNTTIKECHKKLMKVSKMNLKIQT